MSEIKIKTWGLIIKISGIMGRENDGVTHDVKDGELKAWFAHQNFIWTDQ